MVHSALLSTYVRRNDDFQKARELMSERGGQVAKECREATKLSLRRYAGLLRVTPSFLSRIERGVETMPPDLARKMIEIGKRWKP